MPRRGRRRLIWSTSDVNLNLWRRRVRVDQIDHVARYKWDPKTGRIARQKLDSSNKKVPLYRSVKTAFDGIRTHAGRPQWISSPSP